jgi:hypothetical protein
MLNVNEATVKRELAALAGNSTRLDALSKATRISVRRLQELAGGAMPTKAELETLSRGLVAPRRD